MDVQAAMVEVQTFIQRVIFFDHSFSLGDSLRFWRIVAWAVQVVLWRAFQCAFWHALDCALGHVRREVQNERLRIPWSGEAYTVEGDPEVTR